MREGKYFRFAGRMRKESHQFSEIVVCQFMILKWKAMSRFSKSVFFICQFRRNAENFLHGNVQTKRIKKFSVSE
jgi:hypothetical protein